MSFLTWLAIPENHWSIATFLLGVWALYAAAGRLGARASWGAATDRAVFCALTAAAVLAFRWPALAIPSALNVDEARVGAQAIKTMIEPWPWQGFDGGTSGPFTSYAMTLPLLLGAPMTFFWIHLVPVLLGIAIVLVFALGAEALWGVAVGRAASAVPLAFFALMLDPDFLHFSSELVPTLLLTTAFTVLAFAYAGRASGWALAAGGACLGIAPFAKLQSAPLAAYLMLLFAVVLATRPAPRAETLRRAGWLLGGMLAAVAAILGSAAASGSLRDAYISYILYNILYARSTVSVGPSFLIAVTPYYEAFAVGVLALVALCALAAPFARPRRRHLVVLAAALGALAVALYCIEAAHRRFPHYLTFGVVPAAALAGALLAIASRVRLPCGRSAGSWASLVACVAAVVVPTLAVAVARGNPLLPVVSADPVPNDPVVAAVNRLVPQGSTIAVWGWAPDLYVYASARMATKDADNIQEIGGGPYQAYFRERYMTSFLASRPAAFIDAVAPRSFGFHDRASQGFETFPELRDEIAKDFVEVGEVEGIRIFRRRAS